MKIEGLTFGGLGCGLSSVRSDALGVATRQR
jgi:hypothetical protein